VEDHSRSFGINWTVDLGAIPTTIN
jgi:hypothetical protein